MDLARNSSGRTPVPLDSDFDRLNGAALGVRIERRGSRKDLNHCAEVLANQRLFVPERIILD